MAQEQEKAGKTPGEEAKEGVDGSGMPGPEGADAGSIGSGGAPTGPVNSDAENVPGSSSEGAPADD